MLILINPLHLRLHPLHLHRYLALLVPLEQQVVLVLGFQFNLLDHFVPQEVQ